MLFRGCGEESQPSSSVYVVSSHQVYQANQAPIPAPYTVRRPTIARMQSINCCSLTGKIIPKRIIQSQTYQRTQLTTGKKPQPILGNKVTGKTYIDHAEEEKNADFQPVRERSRLPSPKYKEDHNNHHIRETTTTQQILRRTVTTITHGKNNSFDLNIKMRGRLHDHTSL